MNAQATVLDFDTKVAEATARRDAALSKLAADREVKAQRRGEVVAGVDAALLAIYDRERSQGRAGAALLPAPGVAVAAAWNSTAGSSRRSPRLPTTRWCVATSAARSWSAPPSRVSRAMSEQKPSTPTWQGQRQAPTRLVLLRHGQTALSVERRYSGRGNPELTDLGRTQAAAAGKRLGVDTSISAIVSSPLARARATAQAVADVNGLDVEVVDGLTETDFGQWEGLTFLEAAARDPQLHREWLGDVTLPPPGGESFAAVADRIGGVKQSLLERFPGRQSSSSRM